MAITLKNKEFVDKKKLEEMKKGIKSAFKTIKEELEDHLDAINSNTEELARQSDGHYEIEEKIEKLSEKIDSLTSSIDDLKRRLPEKEGFFPALAKQEQKIFTLLYTTEDTPLSYLDIANQLRMPELSVKKIVQNIVGKGIPLLQKKIDDKFFFYLEPKFRELQMKKKIINLEISEF